MNCNVKINEKWAEAKEWKEGIPVRVVGGYKMRKHAKEYAHEERFRYDGKYKVVNYFKVKGNSGRYVLRRYDTTLGPWTPQGRKMAKEKGFIFNPSLVIVFVSSSLILFFSYWLIFLILCILFSFICFPFLSTFHFRCRGHIILRINTDIILFLGHLPSLWSPWGRCCIIPSQHIPPHIKPTMALHLEILDHLVLSIISKPFFRGIFLGMRFHLVPPHNSDRYALFQILSFSPPSH
jgi:hypothetical protein